MLTFDFILAGIIVTGLILFHDFARSVADHYNAIRLAELTAAEDEREEILWAEAIRLTRGGK
jgi:hypothetical protein